MNHMHASAWRAATAAAGLLIVYFLTAVLSLQWATVKGAGAAVWIPAGVGMVGLLFGGIRLWPSIFIARLLAGFATGSEQPIWAELGIAAGNAAATVLGVWLLQGRGGGIPRLDSLRSMLRFLAAGALIPSALAATVGATCVVVSSDLAAADFPLVWLRWASANAASVMVITGLALAWWHERPTAGERWHLAAIVSVNTAAAFLIFHTGPDYPFRAWHIYPFLIWAALALRVVGASSVLLVVGCAAVSGVLADVGPFANIAATAISALMHVQQFLVLTASTILLLSAVADERRGKSALQKAQAELSELNRVLEERVQERSEALRRSERALLQAQKLEALGQLTGGIAHDFNNLLQTINTSFELITRQSGSPEKIEKVAVMGKRATQSAVKLTRQLLTFSRTQELESEVIELGPFLENIKDLVRTSVGSAVTLALDLERAGGVHVSTDRNQLELAIINLAVNARDAMSGGGRLEIGATDAFYRQEPDIPDGRYARIWVRDTGHGMAEDVLARAFEPFFTTKKVGSGTGLGLSMVYGLAKKSGGKAVVESAPGQGTTVSIILPRVEPAGEASSAATHAAPRSLAGVRVLLVDDEAHVRSAIAAMLAELGCHVAEAQSAAEALARIEQEHWGLIVLDHTMPGMLGAELAQRIRQQGKDTPIVLATGAANIEKLLPGDLVRVHLLRKPFSITQLHQAADLALAS
ncbi:MASE1 domain-containing protein [Lysobacter korlensis]|uniref:histidine kinase n=1 Tax=Lysobacter korlensis TaxID=553636 RepID=A0ABV6RL85_9GAMM